MNYEAVVQKITDNLRASQDNYATIILQANFIRTKDGLLDGASIALEYLRLVSELRATASTLNLILATIAEAQSHDRPVSPPATPNAGEQNAGDQEAGS